MLNILTALAKILTNVYTTFVYSTFISLSPKDPKSPEKVAAKALQLCDSGDTHLCALPEVPGSLARQCFHSPNRETQIKPKNF